MGSGRLTPDMCMRYKHRVDMASRIDSIYTESDFLQIAEERGVREHVKLPDCGWHHVSCTYVILELKGGNVERAVSQLVNFARNFSDIHDRVKYYVIRVTSTKHLRGMRCEGIVLCRPYRHFPRGRKYLDILGKPLYLLIEKKQRR